jgi:hypothetical protein
MLEGQIDEEQKIEKPAQSERHSRKTEASEGRQKLPRPHIEMSRKPRSSLKRVVLGALRDFANETGMGHTEIAHELGISPGAILGWMHGTIELRTATLLAIKDFLGQHGPENLPARQLYDQEERKETSWHSFLEYT